MISENTPTFTGKLHNSSNDPQAKQAKQQKSSS